MLRRLGYRGPIIVSEGTAQLLPRVFRGSARLQKVRLEEFQSGRWPEAVPLWLEPGDDGSGVPPTPGPPQPQRLYGADEAEATLRQIMPVEFGERVDLARGLWIRLGFAGHIPGAAHVSVGVGDSNRPIAVFSGDLGSPRSGLYRPFEPPPPCDLLVMESTRGDSAVHDALDPDADLAALLDETRRADGSLLLPTFALGRAQLLVLRLAIAGARGLLEGFRVFLDAPMAEFGLQILRRRSEELAAPLQQAFAAGDDPLVVPGLKALFSRESSLKIAGSPRSIVLAGAGFCDAGPILHHLADGLPRPEVRVGLSGWYPEGGLGWGLLRACTHARIDREIVPVRAGIRRLEGYSGHASSEDLVEWCCGAGAPPARVLLNHGIDSARGAMAARLRDAGVGTVVQPGPGETIEIG
jgi:metallo-beta-lactamase family protein